MSGPASTTVRTASRSPWKSGVSTSIVVPGLRRRIARMVRAKMPAPPSLRSSRSTEVMTACFKSELGDGIGHAQWFAEVELGRAARRHRAEATCSRADVAEDHEGRRPAVPAVEDVGHRASSQTVCRRLALDESA